MIGKKNWESFNEYLGEQCNGNRNGSL